MNQNMTFEEMQTAITTIQAQGNRTCNAIRTYDGSSMDYPIAVRSDLSLIPTGYGYFDTYFQKMAPMVTVNSRNYDRPVFDKTAFVPPDDIERPYGHEMDVSEMYTTWVTKKIKEYAHGIKLDMQQNADLKPFEWERGAARQAEYKVMNKFEIDASTTLKAAGTYTNKTLLAGATLWSAATGVPDTNILAAKETIFETVGAYPNKMFISRRAWNDLMKNAQITALPGVQKDKTPAVMKAIVAARYELDEIVVMDSMYAATPDAAFTDNWGWRCILAVVNPTPPLYPAVEPSFAYTYTLATAGQALPTIHTWLSPSGQIWYVGVHKFMYLDILMETAAYMFYTA